MKVLIGTSGYSYKHWANGVFYPPGLTQSQWFKFYVQKFPTVELNVTFYRLPKPAVFAGWSQKVPPGFRFSIKGSRYITHIKRLKDIKEPLDRLAQGIQPLGKMIDCVLWQFPPTFRHSPQRLNDFCGHMAANPELSGMRHAFEFRNETCFNKETYEIMRKYGFSLCWADPGFQKGQDELTSNFVYLRFHGRGQRYGSNYADQDLNEWAYRVRGLKGRIEALYAYFNNDAYGYAPRNAGRFHELLKEE